MIVAPSYCRQYEEGSGASCLGVKDFTLKNAQEMLRLED
jgi:hypothetical protein